MSTDDFGCEQINQRAVEERAGLMPDEPSFGIKNLF
jgi:hypothetical protein